MDLHGPHCGTPEKLAWRGSHPLPLAEPRPAFAEPAVCIDPGPLARQEQVSGKYTETRTTTHFYMAWDPANTVLDAATLDLAAEALETSWQVEVEEAGWRAPDETDTCLITVVLADMSGANAGTGGWTNVNEEGGVPFIILNTDWFADGDAWTTTLIAHEFNHASQFGYNVFWEEDDWWYWESTAEWSTEMVFPQANAWNYSLWAWMDNPGYALDSQVDLVNYGHFTFNIFLTEQVDADAPLLTWQAATAESDVEAAITAALDVDFDTVLVDYTAHAASMDVNERDAWMATMTDFEVDPYTATIADYPAVDERTGASAPQGRGQNFVHLTGAPGDDLTFEFTGDEAKGGDASRWAVTLSTLGADGTFTHSSALAAEGDRTAALTVPELGADLTDAYIGVIPLADVGESATGWHWNVHRADQAHGPGAETPVACGCSGAGGAASAGFGFAVLAVGLRRVRRAGPPREG